VALKMTNREVDGTSVVTLDGRIVLGEESKSLRERLKGLIAYGQSCWQETAGLMANLDAVVTVDTSILHLVDGMRKPLYILSSLLALAHGGSTIHGFPSQISLLTVDSVSITP